MVWKGSVDGACIKRLPNRPILLWHSVVWSGRGKSRFKWGKGGIRNTSRVKEDRDDRLAGGRGGGRSDVSGYRVGGVSAPA